MATKKAASSSRKRGIGFTTRKNASSGTALVPVEAHARALAPRLDEGSRDATVQREGDTTLVIGQIYPMRGFELRASEVYYVDSLRAERPQGPWLDEADKISWRDPKTGYECIIMRDTHRGFLSGYVGVPVTHPLYGFDHEALPAELGLMVHGGLTYSRICEDGPTPERRIIYEARRICHIRVGEEPIRHGTNYRVQDHAWWFGFSCDHLYDMIPNDRGHASQFLAAETGAVYRDDAYVCNEVQNLAAQLKAIADGAPVPARHGDPLPPRGLDPRDVA